MKIERGGKAARRKQFAIDVAVFQPAASMAGSANTIQLRIWSEGIRQQKRRFDANFTSFPERYQFLLFDQRIYLSAGFCCKRIATQFTIVPDEDAAVGKGGCRPGKLVGK